MFKDIITEQLGKIFLSSLKNNFLGWIVILRHLFFSMEGIVTISLLAMLIVNSPEPPIENMADIFGFIASLMVNICAIFLAVLAILYSFKNKQEIHKTSFLGYLQLSQIMKIAGSTFVCLLMSSLCYLFLKFTAKPFLVFVYATIYFAVGAYFYDCFLCSTSWY